MTTLESYKSVSRDVAINCSVPSRLCSLAPTIWASTSPTLDRAVASSSHCQPVGPKELRARSRPLPKCSQKRAKIRNDSHQKRSPRIPPDRRAINNDQTRSKPIKQSALFPTLAQSHHHRQPPNCEYGRACAFFQTKKLKNMS